MSELHGRTAAYWSDSCNWSEHFDTLPELRRDKDNGFLFRDEGNREIIRINVKSKCVLLTRAIGGTHCVGNDTLTVVLPPMALNRRNTKYFLVVDEGALLYAPRTFDAQFRPMEKIIRHFGTSSGQAQWDRLSAPPPQVRYQGEEGESCARQF